MSERHVFHSLRRSLATELENMGVPENVSADIVGHEKPTMTYGLYSGGNRLEVLREALSRVNFKIPLEIERRLVG
ncbi:tyrosine-type recombinase/integrase [Rhodobacter capsulatus]|uniref:tyrosine-type recombinase/integrase n=1 Tax=Rhodobacter capsulatus TaxID=1061 RepID=UPI0040294FC0